MATGYLHEGESSKSEFHLSAKLSTGVPIQDLVSPSHQVIARSTGVGRAEVALADAEKNSQNRDFILRYRLAGEQVTAGLLLYKGANENFFLAMAQPPRTVAPEDLPPREYVFVLDVSGSMNGFPLDTAKRLMRDLARGLRPVDTFNVVVFADGSQTFAPASVEATPANLAQAIRFIAPKQGGGGTELLAAMKTALRIPKRAGTSRTVVLLTDGYIDAEKDVFAWLRDHLDQANVFSFGIGSGVNRYLIEGVARAGQGEPFVVTGPEHSADAADRFRKYIESPVLTGITATFSGFDAYEVEPRKIPDLFASRPIVMFGKWRGAPAGTIELSGNAGRGAYHTSIAVGSVAADDQNRALGYLWARSRIGNLSDFGAEDVNAVAQVKSLGLAYNLLTPYTSFIAVEERVRHLTGAPADVDQPLALPLGVTDLAVAEPVTSGAEPELVWMAGALLALLGVAAARRRTLMEAA